MLVSVLDQIKQTRTVMTIFLPAACTAQSITVVLAQVFDQGGLIRTNTYRFDLGLVRDTDPVGLVALYSLFAWLKRQGCQVNLVEPDLSQVDPDSLWYRIHATADSGTHASGGMQGDAIPLVRLERSASERWVLTVFNRWLAERMGVSTFTVVPHTGFLSTLMRYAGREGRAGGVYLHASVDVPGHTLRIVLAHDGFGIPRLLRGIWSVQANDALAIARAMEHNMADSEGPPTTSEGLYFLIEDVVIRYAGSVSIYSAFGTARCTPNPLGITQKLELMHGYMPGTLFDVSLNLHATDLLSRINEPVMQLDYV